MTSELRPAAAPPTTNKTVVNRVTNNGERGGPDPQVELTDIMPIASYEGEVGYPYAVNYYQFDTPYEFLDTAIRDDIEVIDSFVKNYIKDEQKEDTISSYSKTLKSLEKKLGIDDNTMRSAAVKKIANLARNFGKVYEAYGKNVRRKVLARLIRMNQEGHSSFDQEEYILNQMGGII